MTGHKEALFCVIAPCVIIAIATPLAPAQPIIINLGSLGSAEGPVPCQPIALSADGQLVVGSCWTGHSDDIPIASSWTPADGWAYAPGFSAGNFEISYLLSASADGARIAGQRQVRPFSLFEVFSMNADGTDAISHRSDPSCDFPFGVHGGLSHDGARLAYTGLGLGPGGEGDCFIPAIPALWTKAGGDGQIQQAWGSSRAVSDTGVVVGFTTPGVDISQSPTAFVYSAAEGLKPLPPLPGEPDSVAAAVTPDGALIFGYSGDLSSAEGHGQLVRWSGKATPVSLAFPPQPFYFIGSSAVAAHGRMLVVSLNSMPSEPQVPGEGGYVWTARDGAMPVKDYFLMLGGDLGNWFLTTAAGVNADGSRIVGLGRSPAEHKAEGYMLVVPAYCDADCNRDGKLNINDFICFQARWVKGDLYSDFDNNNKHNINDFLTFQSAFTRGCP